MTQIIPFSSKIKLYVFKDEQTAQMSFKVSDYCVIKYRLTIDEMTQVVENWRDPGVSGLETEDCGRIWWEYRDCGPRPECVPASFVAVSLRGFEWRLTVDEMEDLCKVFYEQLTGQNHWD